MDNILFLYKDIHRKWCIRFLGEAAVLEFHTKEEALFAKETISEWVVFVMENMQRVGLISSDVNVKSLDLVDLLAALEEKCKP